LSPADNNFIQRLINLNSLFTPTLFGERMKKLVRFLLRFG